MASCDDCTTRWSRGKTPFVDSLGKDLVPAKAKELPPSLQMDEVCRDLAANMVRQPTRLQQLRWWWTEKYHRPWTDDAFQDATEEELLTEWWVDYFRENPLEAHKNESGDVVFKHTGDPLIDKWEHQRELGIEPDYEEGMSPSEIERLRREEALYQAGAHGLASLDDEPDLAATTAGQDWGLAAEELLKEVNG